MTIDIEPRKLIYNRTGNYSQTTTINQELAEKFMRVSDLRRDIVIVDSDKKPEKSAVSVGSDILAWRSMMSFSELSKIVLKPKKFRQMEVIGGQYSIQIHHQIIDDDIRQNGRPNKVEYAERFLTKLNSEVKGALAEALRWEKFGILDQHINYLPYLLSLSSLPANISLGSEAVIQQIGALFVIYHPMMSYAANIALKRYPDIYEFITTCMPQFKGSLPPFISLREGKEVFYPLIPLDKWFQGRMFLAKHGNDLIIPKD